MSELDDRVVFFLQIEFLHHFFNTFQLIVTGLFKKVKTIVLTSVTNLNLTIKEILHGCIFHAPYRAYTHFKFAETHTNIHMIQYYSIRALCKRIRIFLYSPFPLPIFQERRVSYPTLFAVFGPPYDMQYDRSSSLY